MLHRRSPRAAVAGRCRGWTLLLAALPILLANAFAARAQHALNEVVLEDQIAVEILDRTVVAFDLQGSGRLTSRLELDEEVLWSNARGRVAIVLTDRRLLGATPRSAAWQEERYRLSEPPARVAQLSQRLALVITPQRILGFFGSGTWTKSGLGLHEVIVDTRLGPGAGVVVTNRRALGLSSDSGGFFEAKLQIREKIESVRALSSIATVTTSQRTLVFKGPSGIWSAQERSLR